MYRCVQNPYILGFTVMMVGLSAAFPAGAFSWYGPGSGMYYTGFVNTADGVGFSWPWTFVDAPNSHSFQNPHTSFVSLYERPYTVSPITVSPFIPVTYQPYGLPYMYPIYSPQISSLNRAPVFTPIVPQTVRGGQAIQFTVQAHDVDSSYLRYSAVDLPPGATFNDYTHTFFWTPTAFQIGRYPVKFRVSDANAPYVEMSVILIVTDEYGYLSYTVCGAGPGPYLFHFTPPLSVNAGELYAYQVTGGSGNNNPISYRVVDGPTGFTIDEKTGFMQWLIAFNQGRATYPVHIAVYNGQCEVSYNFTITVH